MTRKHDSKISRSIDSGPALPHPRQAAGKDLLDLRGRQYAIINGQFVNRSIQRMGDVSFNRADLEMVGTVVGVHRLGCLRFQLAVDVQLYG